MLAGDNNVTPEVSDDLRNSNFLENFLLFRELSLSMAGKGVEGKYFFLEKFSRPSNFFV